MTLFSENFSTVQQPASRQAPPEIVVPEFAGTLNWSQRGSDLDGEAPGDFSGFSVLLSGDGKTLAVGAPRNDGNGSNSGQVRLYRYDDNNGSWSQLGSDLDGEASGDFSGWSVSLSGDGNTLAVGAPYNDGNGVDSGQVRLYRYDDGSGNWEPAR
ncbi:MAG: hypothetical protein HC824_10575 [Synechococcales cyanobacterium RM1_1_8]|nr:hypothetical protein [Synechococcales cyanobacterium RM1_1_8]